VIYLQRPTELLLVRHGETEQNKNYIIQGHIDTDLNSEGIKKAAATAEFLKDFDYHHIYSSDLRRAKKTADFIADNLNLKINESKNIREINFGNWEGLNLDQIGDKYPEALAAWKKDPLTNGPPGGENITQFAARINSFFNEILDKHQGQKIIVVTHGGVIKMYLREVLEVNANGFEVFQIDNTSLTELKYYEDKVILSKLNFLVENNFE